MSTILLPPLHRLRTRLRSVAAVTAFAHALGAAAIAALAWTLADWRFTAPIAAGTIADPVVRAILLISALAGVVWSGRALRSLGRIGATDEALARHVERARPELAGRLLSAVQLSAAAAGSTSADLAQAQIARVEAELADADHRATVDVSRSRRAVLLAALAVMLLVGMAFAFPGHAATAVSRALLQDAAYPTTVRIVSIEPRDGARIAEGEPLRIRVEIASEAALPANGSVLVRVGGLQDRLTLERDPAHLGSYLTEVPALAADAGLRVEIGDARSPWIGVVVRPRPRLIGIDADLTPPAYLKLPGTSGPFIDGSVPVGSRIRLTMRMFAPVAAAEVLRRCDGEDLPPVPATCSPDGLSATWEGVVDRTTAYRVRLVDGAGLPNRDPATITIAAIPDLPPKVQIVFPPRDTSATRVARWPIRFTLEDDHAIAKLALRWQVFAQETAGPEGGRDLVLGGTRAQETIMALSDAAPVVGNRVEVWVEATDAAGNTTASARRGFQILDPETLRQELESARAGAVEAIDTARERQEDIRDSLRKLATPAKGTP